MTRDLAAFLIALALFVAGALWLVCAIADSAPLDYCPRCQLEGAP